MICLKFKLEKKEYDNTDYRLDSIIANFESELLSEFDIEIMEVTKNFTYLCTKIIKCIVGNMLLIQKKFF